MRDGESTPGICRTPQGTVTYGFTVGTRVNAINRSSVDAAFHERAMTRKEQELTSALRRAAAFVAVLALRVRRLSTRYQFLSAARCPIKESSAGHIGLPEAGSRSLTRSPPPA